MTDWERPIIFEGFTLPDTIIAIDHLGMYDNLPEMSEETSVWLWRFTICVGMPRSERSEIILRHTSETRDLINRFRERLLRTVPAQYQGTFTEAILDSWVVALQTIMNIAADRVECTWESPLVPGEPGYDQSPAERLAELASRLDKVINRVRGNAN